MIPPMSSPPPTPTRLIVPQTGHRDVQEHTLFIEGGGGAPVRQNVDPRDNVVQIGASDEESDPERGSTETTVHRPPRDPTENKSLISLHMRDQLSAEIAARAEAENMRQHPPRNDISENKHDTAWLLGRADHDIEPRARTGSSAAPRTGEEHVNMLRDPATGDGISYVRDRANPSNTFVVNTTQTTRQSVLPTLTSHSTHNLSQSVNPLMSPPPPLEHPTPRVIGAKAIDQGGDATDVEGALNRFADTASVDDSDTQSIVSVASTTMSEYILSGRTAGAREARTPSVHGYYSMPRGRRIRDSDLSEGGGTDVERHQRKRVPSKRQGYPHGERIIEGERYSSERKKAQLLQDRN